jgi:hypothetical protein
MRNLGIVHLTPILLLAKPGWKSQICYIGPFLWIDALFSFLSHRKPLKGSKIWYSGRCKWPLDAFCKTSNDDMFSLGFLLRLPCRSLKIFRTEKQWRGGGTDHI